MPQYVNSDATPNAQAPVKDLLDFTHPDYRYYSTEWEKARDCLAGESRIKELGQKYLPPISSDSDAAEYKTYKERAVFINMVGRTVSGLVGTVFRRPVKYERANDKIKKFANAFSKDGESMNLFAKRLSYEVCAIGRIGMLVDRSSDGKSNPYVVPYIAENILDWEYEVIDGHIQYTYVLLRELVDLGHDVAKTPNNGYQRAPQTRIGVRFRSLHLDNGVYRQEIRIPDTKGHVDLTRDPDNVIYPLHNGNKLDYIPFLILGTLRATPQVQRPVVADIVSINLAHYRASAQLEHGRFYTAMPVYYVPLGNTEGRDEYRLGGGVVWETPTDTKPGILEYYGHGLQELANSLVSKEEAIAQLGGRTMGIRPAGTTESEQVYKMKQANEMATLLDITDSVGEGLTTVLRWALTWADIKHNDVEVHLNQDFIALTLNARDLRAISLLYQQGILPLNEVYRVLQDSQFIADELSYDEFKSMIATSP